MKYASIPVWLAIGICFVRGLFVFDMGTGAANHSYPAAGGICLGGSVIAASVMMLFHAVASRAQQNP